MIRNDNSNRLLTRLSQTLRDLGNTNNLYKKICFYMECAVGYRIRIVIIVQNPYNHEIVPMLGSSYYQRRDTGDTPTALMLQMHMGQRGQLLK